MQRHANVPYRRHPWSHITCGLRFPEVGKNARCYCAAAALWSPLPAMRLKLSAVTVVWSVIRLLATLVEHTSPPELLLTVLVMRPCPPRFNPGLLLFAFVLRDVHRLWQCLLLRARSWSSFYSKYLAISTRRTSTAARPSLQGSVLSASNIPSSSLSNFWRRDAR